MENILKNSNKDQKAAFDRKHYLLKDAPVLKSLIFMIIPTLFTAIVAELNSAISAFFLKHVSIYASSSVTISWPIMCIMLAISYTLSLGSSIKIGHYLGKKNIDKARTMASTTVWLTLWINILAVFLLMIKLKTVILFFGADKNTLLNTYNYLKIMLPGMIFEDLAYIAAMYLRAEGNVYPVVGAMVVQTIISILLNILLVLHLNWGLSGAALASAISFILQAVILYFFLCQPKSMLKISFRMIKINTNYFKVILSYGASGFCILTLFAVGQFVLNREASHLSTDYLTANTVLLFLLSLAFSFNVGITDGASPLLSYSYGAKDKLRLLNIAKWQGVLTTIISIIVAFFLFFFTHQVSSLFTSNEKGIQLASTSIHLAGIAILLTPMISVISSLAISIGRGIMAAVMNTIRQFLVIIFAIVLSYYFGGSGLILSQPLALIVGGIGMIIFVPALITHIKRIDSVANP